MVFGAPGQTRKTLQRPASAGPMNTYGLQQVSRRTSPGRPVNQPCSSAQNSTTVPPTPAVSGNQSIQYLQHGASASVRARPVFDGLKRHVTAGGGDGHRPSPHLRITVHGVSITGSRCATGCRLSRRLPDGHAVHRWSGTHFVKAPLTTVIQSTMLGPERCRRPPAPGISVRGVEAQHVRLVRPDLEQLPARPRSG